jgi:hypothetical protein
MEGRTDHQGVLAKLERAVAYNLKPADQNSDYHWEVADGVRVIRSD